MKKNLLILALILLYTISSYAQAPTITFFSPASGPVGTLVTITGTNLSSPTAFTIGGVAAIKVSGTATTLVGMVMPGAVTGAVSVTTAGGTIASGSNFTITATGHPSAQQGPKLVGTGGISTHGQGGQGVSVAISADGNTAIVGDLSDSSDRGAVWIYFRSGSVWQQQGSKLVGTGAIDTPFAAEQGVVAISADGNTAIVGGPNDNNSTGAAWIFTRTGHTWAQQGPKLVGTSAIGVASQGGSVALSADGNTAIIGGINDNNHTGAVWIFTRTGSIWTQHGAKLVGTGATGPALQGTSCAISADGNTVIVGGYWDDTYQGAAWIFHRSGVNWIQQGSKLVGIGAIYYPFQGGSVALSADGKTAIVGGAGDNNNIGAAWVFSISGGTWTQQGPKLVGTGYLQSTLGVDQGCTVSLSADGNTALVGGPFDSINAIAGAFWVYSRSGPIWTQLGSKLVGNGTVGSAHQGGSVSLSADGNTAIEGGLFDNNGVGAAWLFCMPSLTNVAATICPRLSYTFAGQILTQAGIYHDTLTNASGCDSIVTLTLAVNNATGSAFAHSICSGSSYTFGSHTLTSAGTYHDTLTNAGGCDSIVTLTLTVNVPTAPTITRHGDTLLTNANGHWVWSFNRSPVPADTLHSLVISANGIYSLTETDSNGCIILSNFIDVTNLGISDISMSNIRLYPNPASESFTLSADAAMIGTSYTFTDITGRIIHSHLIEKENNIIPLDGLSSGIYILQIDGGSYKMVKE